MEKIDLSKDVQAIFSEAIKKVRQKSDSGLITQHEVIPRLRSGSLSLDMALGGGYPIGRITEIAGQKSHGKSTLAALAMKSLFEKNPNAVVAYIDAESAIDLEYWRKLGLTPENVRRIGLSNYDVIEDVDDLVVQLLRDNSVDLVIIDSIGALTSLAELEGSARDQQYGGISKGLGKFLRRSKMALKQSKATLIFINQLRANVGGGKYEAEYITPGGMALGYYASIQFHVRRVIQWVNDKERDNVAGYHFMGKMEKNKTTDPFQKFDIPFIVKATDGVTGELVPVYQVDTSEEIVTIAKELGWFLNSKGEVLTSTGTYHYNGVALGTSLAKAIEYLDAHPELASEITERIYDHILQQNIAPQMTENIGETLDEATDD